MATPSFVLKQAEEAERLFQDQQKLAEEAAAKEKEEHNEPVVDPDKDKGKVDGVDGVPPRPDDKPADDKGKKPDDQPPVVTDWEHKYNVLQGKYNHEVPDLSTRLSQALSQISALSVQVEDLNKKLVLPAASTGDKSFENIIQDPKLAFVKETYPQIWDALELVLKESISKNQADIRQLSSKIETEHGVSVKNRINSFYDTLDGKVSDWGVINVSQEFTTWLQEPVPYTGTNRGALLKSAYDNLDTAGVIRFFEDFKAEAVRREAANKVTETEIEKKAREKKEKDAGLPRSQGTKIPREPGNDNLPKISQAEITQFYDDVRRNQYRGREDDMKKREAEIEAAIVQGRVV